jgi:hypothetical protein
MVAAVVVPGPRAIYGRAEEHAAGEEVHMVGRMARTTTALVLGLVALAVVIGGVAAGAAKKKPPAPQKRVVQGTSQLKGDQGEFGLTYTLGKESPINFTLKSCEYLGERKWIGTDYYVPTGEEKLLVLHFTLQNPQPAERGVGWSVCSFTAVDASNTNREYPQNIGVESNQEVLNLNLKPAQKIDAYTVITVPAQGEVPKLIVKSQDQLVIRYDLRKKVKGLSAPFADPADKSGATARSDVPAVAGTYYPVGMWDARLDSTSYTTQAIKEEAPEGGVRYLVLNMTFRNPTKSAQSLGWSALAPKVRTTDGENLDWNQELLYASRDETISMDVEPGQEAKVRYYFTIPSGSTAKQFSVQQSDEGRRFTWDMTGTQ